MSPQNRNNRIVQALLVSPHWTPQQSQKGEMNMAKKRGNNEGTVYKRKDGRWRAQVSLTADASPSMPIARRNAATKSTRPLTKPNSA